MNVGLVLAAVSAGVLGIAGCASNSAQADQIPPRLVTPSPTQIDPKEQAVAAARSVLDQWHQVNTTLVDPATALPVLDQYLVGVALEQAKKQMQEGIKEGATWSGDRKIVSVQQAGKVKVDNAFPKNGEWRGPEVAFRVCVDLAQSVKHVGAKSYPLDDPSKPFLMQTTHVYGLGDVPATRQWKIADWTDTSWVAQCGA